MPRTPRMASLALLASAALIGAAPSGAYAANTFVDATRPNDSGSCLTPAQACRTIAGGIAKAGVANTVFVVDPAAPTTYSESVVLDAGKSLRALSQDPAETIIDNGGGTTPTILVAPSGGGGTIQGFTIRSDRQAILAQDQITIAGNRFDESAALTSGSRANVQLDPAAGGSSLTGNVFIDPTPLTTELQRGVLMLHGGGATIASNSFSGFSEAISIASGVAVPLISGNQISGAHPGAGAGAAIHAIAGGPTLVGNVIESPDLDGGDADGVAIDAAASATLRRNRITGHTTGVLVDDAHGVSLNSDLIARSAGRGLRTVDTGADQVGPGDATVTNATIVESAGVPPTGEIQLDQTQLTLNSTIVGNRGIAGTGTCLISHSRGPATSGDPCDAFQTSASPGFVNPGSNYHLRGGSAMIDAGDPSAPAFGELDFDGNLRALDAILPCGVRRDIGADEFAATIDCESPNTSVRGPSKVRTRKKRARISVTFTATEVGSFQCSVDDAAFVLCSSPFTTKLGRGKHVLTVRAVDLSANPDTSPARLGITVARKKKKKGKRRER
jgi:hypothetical protein